MRRILHIDSGYVSASCTHRNICYEEIERLTIFKSTAQEGFLYFECFLFEIYWS